MNDTALSKLKCSTALKTAQAYEASASQRPTDRGISLNDVCQVTSLSRTMINNLRAEGRFPIPTEIGGRLVFLESEVLAWLAARMADRPSVDRMAGKVRNKAARAAA